MHLSAPHPLWTQAGNLFAAMLAEIGAASVIAALATLTRRRRREILDWLAPLEALVRKVLLIEAAALSLPRRRPPTGAAAQARTARPRRAPAFALPIPPDHFAPQPLEARIRVLGPPLLLRDVWRERDRAARIAALNAHRTPPRPAPQRLAERIEALARVLDNPGPHARRLARKLRRERNPHYAARRLTRARPRDCGRCYGAIVAAESGAFGIVHAFPDTS